MLLFESSMSHQFLWSSSSFCSAMSRKIIFWIMLLTSSKGPPKRAATSSAKRAKAREWTLRASSRSKLTARALGSWFCKSSRVGEGGGTGLEGASVRTPATLERISMPAASAFISCSRTSERSSHSDFFIAQDCFVLLRVVESAFKSSLALLREFFASARSVLTSPSKSVFVLLAASAACTALARASSASSYAFCAFVSAFVPSIRSSSKLRLNSFSSSITLPDLKVYFFLCAS
mmetsp:Transcript_124097/g.345444  ORF Transcript_124097/g.345444 Transcript_124097/m.345444 type:complete len:234 (+) Transcript_124097:1072-1773(+)